MIRIQRLSIACISLLPLSGTIRAQILGTINAWKFCKETTLVAAFLSGGY